MTYDEKCFNNITKCRRIVQLISKQDDFAGKVIYLIATQGSSGFASSTKDIEVLVPEANVIEMLSIYCDDIPKSVDIILTGHIMLIEIKLSIKKKIH